MLHGLFALLCGLSLLASGDGSPAAQGVIVGRFTRDGEPLSARVNLHLKDTGLFFGSVESGQNGYFAFTDLPLGGYFLITNPVTDMPLQWSTTGTVELTQENPVAVLPPLECYAVRVVAPLDGTQVQPTVSAQEPIRFEWTAYPGPAQYRVEVSSTDSTQKFISQPVSDLRFQWDGAFADGSRLGERPYRWVLVVTPADSPWRGRSVQQDLLVGDIGGTETWQTEYMELTAPRWFKPTVEKFGLLDSLDLAYSLQKELTGTTPFEGARYGILYDPQILFCHSGNPVHIGKGAWAENDFPWDLVLHEMGHDFQTGTLVRWNLITIHPEDPQPFYPAFTEGMATLAAFYVDHRATTHPGHLGLIEANYSALHDRMERNAKQYRTALRVYTESGCPVERITADVVDGMMLEVADRYGWAVFPRFFKAFQEVPETQEVFEKGDSASKRLAVIAAALSAAAGEDLVGQFERWGFRLDKEFAAWATPLLAQAVGQ